LKNGPLAIALTLYVSDFNHALTENLT